MFTPDIDPVIERLWVRLDEAQYLNKRQAAEIERLRDRVDGLDADLRCAIQTAYNRGATEWARLNYPDMIDWLVSSSKNRAAITGEEQS